jgi:Raf kinase inhibitor-like YbhB/YbcL family protein
MSYDPYSVALPAPEITLLSLDFTNGGALPRYAFAAAAGGLDEPPAVQWDELPDGTESLFVTLFDADAPIPGGFWHWAVAGITATEIGLPRGAAGSLPGPAAQLGNSMGAEGYAGANPPPGTGTHHNYLAVTALSTPALELPANAGLALVHAVIIPHMLGRGVLVATAE